MLTSVCELLKSRFPVYVGITPEVHGLAVPKTAVIAGERKTFPYEYAVEDCNTKTAILPDKSKSILAWFESDGNTATGSVEGYGSIFETTVRLSVWVNAKNVNESDPLISDKIQRKLIDVFNSIRSAKSTDQSVNILGSSVVYIRTDSRSIFRQYTFTEFVNFTTYPFSVFQIEMKVKYTVACQTIEISPAEC